MAATVELMSEKGYKAVTIKEIAAAASVSEMTVFRTFGSKKAILEAILKNYMFSTPIEQIIKQNITYELEADLLMISKLYHDVLKRDKKIYLISVMERKTMPEIHRGVHNNAARFLNIVTEYLKTMQEKGKVVQGDPEIQAMTVMKFNYGKFIASTMLEGIVPEVRKDHIEESISILARGLKT